MTCIETHAPVTHALVLAAQYMLTRPTFWTADLHFDMLYAYLRSHTWCCMHGTATAGYLGET